MHTLPIALAMRSNFSNWSGMAKSPKDDDYTEEEARRRFEKAVDAALHTPPMHRAPKKTAKAKAKKAKAKR